MRLMAAALALSLTLAVVAAVFALWPVVADAPWESSEDSAPVVQPVPTLTQCEELTELLAKAQTELAARQFSSRLQSCYGWRN